MFTEAVNDTVFKAVHDSPVSLPGQHKWVTRDQDVRAIKKLIGMTPETIGAPLWVSGDRKRCRKCSRETDWLDIVSSALGQVHAREMIARVILGEQKCVNTEASRAIVGLKCSQYHTPFEILRRVKCLNWAYALPQLLEVLRNLEAT